jgi:beta-glucosidase
MGAFLLKEGFLIGTASAATQIEGGEPEHSWTDWYRKGHIKDGSSPARANGHWLRWREDDALMAKLGMQIARVGVEWARVEPRMDCFDEEAIARYVAEVKLLQSLNIKPLITLHHFTNPLWFEALGAFEKMENVPRFTRFAEKMVKAFGSLVTEYITLNEPNVYAVNGYFAGIWPPGAKSFARAMRVMSVLTAAHVAVYKRIHAIHTEMDIAGTRVSYANHMRVFAPGNPRNPMHRISAAMSRHLFQGALSRAMGTGRFSLPVHNLAGIRPGLYCDFIALNYYSRSTIKKIGDGVRENAPVNDLGWEIYPQGIVECAEALYTLHPLPIYITENGTCDNRDAFRSRYLYDHLRAVSLSGLPFERYYHWCFTDNFEWLDGESARFGIVRVDYDTQARAVKESGRFLAEIIKRGGVDERMYASCVARQAYPTNRKAEV